MVGKCSQLIEMKQTKTNGSIFLTHLMDKPLHKRSRQQSSNVMQPWDDNLVVGVRVRGQNIKDACFEAFSGWHNSKYV